MKKFIFGLIIIIVLIIIAGAISEKNKTEPPTTPTTPTTPTAPAPTTPPAPTIPPPVPPTTLTPAAVLTSRSFQMGFVPITAQPLSTENWLAAFDLFKGSAEMIMHHVDFAADALASVDFISQMAERAGLKLFVVVDPLAHDRQAFDPNLKKLGANFADTKVRQAYKDLAVKLAGTYRPAYLGLGSEINTYLAKSDSELTAYLTLLGETVAAVKQASSRTVVTVSVQYEELSGAGGRPAQWEMLRQLETKVEAVAFTTYPSPFFAAPDKLPADYYTKIRAYTNKPLLIAESGWPTTGSASASAANQVAFLERLPELTKDLNLRLWIWWFPHDWAGAGYADVFKTMGLRQANGAPKPAWDSWLKIKSLPIR